MRVRPQILSAARELFLEQGLDVTLDAIATRAGTTRQTLYNHFANKTTLLIEVFEGFKSDLETPFSSAAAETMPIEDLLAQVGQAVQAHFYDADVLRLLRLLIVGMVQMPNVLPELEQRRTGSVRRLLTAALVRERARGVIQVEHAEDAAKAFLGAVMGPMFPLALLGGSVPSAEELQRLNLEACHTFLCAWRPAARNE